MSVLTEKEIKEDWYLEAVHLPRECFVCGDRLMLPIIHWHGTNGDLFVCPDCARYLGQHLIADALKVVKAK